jgi:DNA-binding CsgD family transcriptional regulator/tetratricopeptide (TPR) repeat protein
MVMAQRLRGRDAETAALDRLLDDVRAGDSRALVLRGEPGVGKTALLDYVQDRAPECRVLRAAGVESEMELAFAGLHQLCGPVLGSLARLPDPQRDALSTAFGLGAGEAPDRFMVSLAALGLLSEVSEERPLVCLVDDAQWLDRASAQAVAFVARRLLAEPVAMVFAVREPLDEPVLTGVPELEVAGLSDADSRALLASVVPGRLDQRVRDRIVAETRGNPLALLELPRGLTAAELAGGFGRPDARPLASRIEQSFRRQLDALPPETQQLLLTAAAEPVGDAALLWRTAEALGIPADAAAPAEAAGLIELGARTRFRHPLVRAAAYRAAPLSDRRQVHRALADATDPETDPDRRAWHLAHAAVGPDEAVAEELERSAGRAQARGGIAAAAAFLERATELTPDPAQRSARALAAAHATFAAGAPDAADELLAMAELGPLDELHRGQLARLRAQLDFTRTRDSNAPRLLLDAAGTLEALDVELARETYLEALGAAIFAGRLGGIDEREAAEATRAAPAAPLPPRPMDVLLDAMATRFTDGYVASAPSLKRALGALRQDPGRDEEHTMGWRWLVCPVAPDLWDDETWNQLTAREVTFAREAGALTALPVALTHRAGVHVLTGEFTVADGLIAEAEAITTATGNAAFQYSALVLAAWRGEEAPARALIEGMVDDGNSRGEGRALGLAWHATAVLYNGLGRYDDALAAAQRACEHEDLSFYGWSLVELVEAAARSGADAEAATALRQLDRRTQAAGSDWALGLRARSQALLSDGDAAEACYQEAIERLGRSRIAVHLARAHLVYGEWLRREQRRVDAREQLRAAHAMFTRFGAEAFAERSRRELQATGETVRTRTVEARDVLTAQEAQVARLAAAGHTNSEIGAQLFISPRTAEYHLHKVFTKLDVTSRRQLPGRLAQLEQRAG